MYSKFRDDITVIGVPLTAICNREYKDPRQRQLFLVGRPFGELLRHLKIRRPAEQQVARLGEADDERGDVVGEPAFVADEPLHRRGFLGADVARVAGDQRVQHAVPQLDEMRDQRLFLELFLRGSLFLRAHGVLSLPEDAAAVGAGRVQGAESL